MTRALLLCLCLLAPAAQALTRAESNAKPFAVVIDFLEGGNCSGTIVGPQTILTANHCLLGDPEQVMVNRAPVAVTAVRRLGGDIAEIDVTRRFPRYAPRGDRPRQGDPIFFFGNPVGKRDLLRRGYIAGEDAPFLLTDIVVGGGDSGAGVFNQRGQVVGVVYGWGGAEAFVIGLVSPL